MASPKWKRTILDGLISDSKEDAGEGQGRAAKQGMTQASSLVFARGRKRKKAV
jgi:hypothetical protein